MKSGVSPSSALFMVISLTLETHLAAIYGGLVSSFTTKHLSIIVQAARFSATVQDRSGFHDKHDRELASKKIQQPFPGNGARKVCWYFLTFT
jgi:hypothetical protein